MSFSGSIEYYTNEHKKYYSDYEVWYKWYTKRDCNKVAITRYDNISKRIQLTLIKN